MKKLLFLLPILIAPSAVRAAAIECAVNLKLATCATSGVTYIVNGSTTGSTAHTEKCYTMYDSNLNTVVGHEKFITSIICDTSNGYTAKSSTDTRCIDSTTATTSITYYRCDCFNYDTYNNSWTSYSTAAQRDSGTRKNCGTSSTIYRYRCKSGYYSAAGYASATTESALQCTTCPANATCSAGATTFTCNAGYYKDGNACTACATTCGAGHTTSTAGATSYAECKAPAATMLTDDTGTFSYSTACCCDDTCDSKCDSGKSCDIDSECESGVCTNGCCKPVVACPIGSDPCTTVADCPSRFGYTCTDGCCVSKTPTATCSRLSVDYCTLTDTSNCTATEICDTTTNCCTAFSTSL